jgi:hypothetical protein
VVIRAICLTCLSGAVWSAFGAWASAASANWLPAESVSPSIGIRSCPIDRTQGPFLARDAAGDAVVAWVRAGKGPIGENFVIEATARSAGGAWRRPSVIASGTIRVPVVAMTASGEAVVVWPSTRYPRKNRYSKARESVNVRTLATHSSSAWSAEHVLAAHLDPGGFEAADPQIGVNAGGEIAVAFRIAAAGSRERSRHEEVMLSRRPVHAAWEPSARIATLNNGGYELQAGLADSGKAVVAWNTAGPRGEFEGSPVWVEAVTVAADGRPVGRPQVLSSRKQRAIEMRLAINAKGESVVAFRMGGRKPGLLQAEGTVACDVEGDSDEGSYAPLPDAHGYGIGEGPERVTRNDDNGRFGKPVRLAEHSLGASAAISPGGEAAILFEHDATARQTVVEAAFGLAGGGWSAPTSTPVNSLLAGLGFDEAGDLKTVFSVRGGFEVTTHTSEAWGSPEAVSAPENSNQGTAIITSTGSTTLAWLATTGNRQIVSVRSSD